MDDIELKLISGSLLHDIGKVVYREKGDKRTHSQNGYDYLKEEVKLTDEDILNCVRYHHVDALKEASIETGSPAYIVYMADQIASSVDQKENQVSEQGVQIHTPLKPVFNILNGNQQELYYHPGRLEAEGNINYPEAVKTPFDEKEYRKIVQNISENLKKTQWNKDCINSVMEVLEENLSYVPSVISQNEVSDISLYDHVKMTAAAASCIREYLKQNKIQNYKEELFLHEKEFYLKNVFLLASMDISGIQKFIYTITTKNALRTLRARSFYLEIMLEHIIDLLLERVNLTRANLIYSGGGHCYLLLPDTKECKENFDDFMHEINQWFLEKFQISLYIAGAVTECCSNTLRNIPEGSYADMFKKLSVALSEKKSRRYSAKEIWKLNNSEVADYRRECSVCKKIGSVDENGVCPMCRAIEKLSQKVLYSEFFSVIKGEKKEELPLPGGYCLVADDKMSLEQKLETDKTFVRTYSKNKMYSGKHISTKLWVGNYTNGNAFETFAKEAKGIDRIGVLRADVDNLGHAFVAGFDNPKNQNKYVTLSRTATLSRQLSLFFKLHINRILAEPKFTLDGKKKDKRNATIVYSGGDDLFIVGAWNEVIELAIDIRRTFEKYTEGTLSISAGIGIYHDSYPISVIAEEVEKQEEKSKNYRGKNAVTLMEDGRSHTVNVDGQTMKVSDGTYSWTEFEEEVIGKKYKAISEFFNESEDRGKVFLYNLLELIRNQRDRINFARYVYFLSRMEPESSEPKEKQEAYQKFSRKMYEWIQSEKDCRQLKTAMNLYVYLMRETEG